MIRHGPGNLERRLHRIFCLSFVTSSIFAMQTTQLSVNGFRRAGGLPSGIKCPEREADHSHPCCRTYEMCGAEPPSFAETWYLGYMASFRFVYVSQATLCCGVESTPQTAPEVCTPRTADVFGCPPTVFVIV